MATFSQFRDELKTCPYNPAHKVATRRYQQHIVKCAKNPNSPQLLDCPFNAMHKIAPQNMKQHIHTCRDSRPIIREIEESRNVKRAQPVLTQRAAEVVSSENWDSELDGEKKTYVIRGLGEEDKSKDDDDDEKPFRIKTNIEIQMMKPSERKQYYAQLVEHTKQISKLNESTSNGNSTADLNSTANSNPTNGTPSSARNSIQRTITNEYASTSPSILEASLSSPVTVKTERTVGFNDVRKPRKMPFGVGLGRGMTPNYSSTPRTVGRSNDRDVCGEFTTVQIKREHEDDEPLQERKRLSPEIPF